MDALQARILAAWPSLGVETAKLLLVALRKQLFKAHEDGLLQTPPDQIYKFVRSNPPANDEILGGIKDFRRDPGSACLVRDDGAWIHFTILVHQEDKTTLQLVAYDFEIVFPPSHTPPWVRLDLNPPSHPNELRSHLHPGNDELLLPAPVMTPQEILDHFVRELRPRDPDKPRDGTKN